MFEGPAAYVCEQSQAEKKPCKFKISKVILQQAVDREQAKLLLTAGRTALLKDFVSSKSGRQFTAHLIVGDSGQIGFEFPPREAEVANTPAT